MAHARRYFDKALSSDKVRAEHALRLISELYTIERRCDEKKALPELQHRYRRRRALPLLDDLEKWLKEEIIMIAPKSPLRAGHRLLPIALDAPTCLYRRRPIPDRQ
ncbi:MAG: transposase [Flavobacteriales bacterium]|jgi:hypothetical protein|nr:transposase [Flavobacteriales bacterium]